MLLVEGTLVYEGDALFLIDTVTARGVEDGVVRGMIAEDEEEAFKKQ
jgi:hypothetical protein